MKLSDLQSVPEPGLGRADLPALPLDTRADGTPPPRKSRVIWWTIAVLGLALAIYFTLRADSRLRFLIAHTPKLEAWLNSHGQFRNFPAYALLAIPFLALALSFEARLRGMASLAVFAAGLELVQGSIPSRYCEWEDVAWSWAGLAAAWLVFEALRWIWMTLAFLRPSAGRSHATTTKPLGLQVERAASGSGSRREAATTSARGVLDILIVVEPGLDGVFRHVEGLVEFLLARGQRVHLAYSSRRSSEAMMTLVRRVSASGGTVADLRVANKPEPGDAAALWRLVRLIRRARPRVIHAHSSKAGALARIAAGLTGVPRRLYSPHAYYGMAKPFSIRVSFFNAVERALGRRGQTVAISNDEAAFARETLAIPARRLRVVHNPVDSGRFVPATDAQRIESRRRLGIPETAKVIATVGRMCWQKDPETAYAAVARAAAEDPSLFFLHLGWGQWKGYLQDQARRLGLEGRYRLVDYTDYPLSIYHATDATLISSRYEAGWPLVLLEALACDLPVIAATCPGMSDVGRAGLSHVWTFFPEDVNGCHRAICQWTDDAVRAPGRPCNHRLFAQARLSPERCYGSLLKLYADEAALADSPVAPVGPALQPPQP